MMKLFPSLPLSFALSLSLSLISQGDGSIKVLQDTVSKAESHSDRSMVCTQCVNLCQQSVTCHLLCVGLCSLGEQTAQMSAEHAH